MIEAEEAETMKEQISVTSILVLIALLILALWYVLLQDIDRVQVPCTNDIVWATIDNWHRRCRLQATISIPDAGCETKIRVLILPSMQNLAYTLTDARHGISMD